MTLLRAFTYDDLNRLETAAGTFGPNQSQQNCTEANRNIYNAIGNLVSKCGVSLTYGDPMHPSAVTFNPATGKGYTYDANGNMTGRGAQTLTWDIDNRVISVSIGGGGTTVMVYDYTGMRVKKDAPSSGLTLFPFKGYEIDASGTITKFIKVGNETLATKKTTNAGALIGQFFYHNDHLGGVNVITDISGSRCQLNEYDPWGSVSKSEGATPGSQPTCDTTHRFTGKELDPESGLYYYGGRYYDAEISRFVSPDPYVQEPDEPQNLNRYTYVLNNPQGYVDPDGHFFWLIPAIAAVVATVVAELVPGLLVVEGTLTALGVATHITITAAQIGTFTANVVNNAELRHEGTKQKPTDANQATRNNQQQPGNSNSQNPPGNDLNEKPWWHPDNWCIGPCDAHASEEGERPAGTPPPAIRRPPLRPRGSPIGPTDYVNLPNGRNIPIPQGWQGRIANNDRGIVFQRPGATGDADSIRIMDPNRQNPSGYIKYHDSLGRALDVKGNPVSPNSAAAHIPWDYNGPISGLWKLYGRTP